MTAIEYCEIHGLDWGLLPLPHRSLAGPGPAVGAISRFRHIKQWFFGFKIVYFPNGFNVDETGVGKNDSDILDCKAPLNGRKITFLLTNFLLNAAVLVHLRDGTDNCYI